MRWNFQLSQYDACHKAHCAMRSRQDVWIGVCRLENGYGKDVANVSICNVCKGRGTTSCRSAKATSYGISPKTRMTVAKHTRKEELRLDGLTKSGWTSQICWHSQLSVDAVHDNKARFRKVRGAKQNPWAHVCQFKYGIRQKVAEMPFHRVCESHTSISSVVRMPRTDVLIKRDRCLWQSVHKEKRSPREFAGVEGSCSNEIALSASS